VIARSLFAALVYLVPVGVVFALRARDDRSLWEVASDIPLAVAADLWLVLLLSRFMVLDAAAIASRAAWLAIAVGGALWRRRRGGAFVWPQALDWRIAGQTAVLALLALASSLTLSRPCAIWDRDWHIPLVASLGGQRFPFDNVYDVNVMLTYHFTGDVLAGMLRAFSGNAFHASLALSLAHDLVFALIGAQIGLLVGGTGLRRLSLAVLVEAATLLAGPITLLRDPTRKLESGYSMVNFLSLSFRPHSSLAYLLVLGVVTTVLGRLHGPREPASARRLWPALAASVAVLALTDEASLVLVGVGLGALWLLDGQAFGGNRRAGMLVLVALGAIVIVTLLLFVGALGPGAPGHALGLVAPRAPGFLAPPVPFAAGGWRLVIEDLGPILLVGLGGVVLCHRASRELRLSVLFYLAILVAAVFAFCCTEAEHSSVESHRWATAPFVMAPILAAGWLGGAARARGWAVLGGWAALLIYVGSSIGVASTVEWLGSGMAERVCHRDQMFSGFASDRFYDVDCRQAAGTRLHERPRVTYLEPDGAYLYAGCRPTFLSGDPRQRHKIKSTRPQFGRAAIDDIDRTMLPRTAPLTVACLTGSRTADVVCARARAQAPCEPAGAAFEDCVLTGAARADLLNAR
jgi:hypothetical protein